MARNKVKSSTTSFSNFLIIFLTLGTVIVFAVLLVLSYKSMQAKYIGDFVRDSLKVCKNLSIDLSFGENEKGLIEVLNSDDYSNVQNAFIVDRDGNILSAFSAGTSRIPYNSSETGSMITDNEVLRELRLLSSNGVSYSGTERNGFYVVSINEIKGTDLCVIIVRTDTYSAANQNFVSIMLIPSLIAIIFALVLFITFIELTVAPIKDISSTVLKVADGNYKARVSSKYTDASDIRNISVTSDITAMAKTVNTMIESLENQEADRSVFISSIAHDIRTPLTSINGFITAILDGTIQPEDREKYLLKMKHEVEKIKRLVISMTEASSLSHVDPDVMEEFPIKEAIDDICDSLEPQLGEKQIELVRDLDLRDDTFAYGEAQQLCRVIMNIITNSIKFTPFGGKIILRSSVQKSENKIYISVEDSGPGVPEDKRSRVFDSFYKTDPSRKKEGFGLGLYICKQILIGHDESIHLEESAELGGAKFVFTLPMKRKAEE